MVDFQKRLGRAAAGRPVDPLEIYEGLDRASDKGPLRPAQKAILQEWYAEQRRKTDLIIKLHTGQGKTLIGLLILQSLLNDDKGPALYLCANNFLVNQTVDQAHSFGFKQLADSPDDPQFTTGKAILITTVNKLFNGLSQFGLGAQSLEVSSIVMDDSHACVDAIREACSIRLPAPHQAYRDMLALFETDLQHQGVGTFADIRRGQYGSLLPVPYWAWQEREHEVAELLSIHSGDNRVKFAWPLLKDGLRDCMCVISGGGLEIAPFLAPTDKFGSYARAGHRVFMSATVTNDAFLIKGLGLAPTTIERPLTYKDERWSGEKMVLVPSLIDDSLTREAVVGQFGKRSKSRKFGVVVLVPSFDISNDWKTVGASIADRSSIDTAVERLRNGEFEETVAIVNKYDGIDLPDNSCRILIIDSKPFSEGLVDRYVDGCRPSSDATTMKLARRIEQGLGRAVRGEKDYCVVILTGPALVRAIRSGKSKLYFSEQTRAQVDLGLEIAELAKQDIGDGADPVSALFGLVQQCLGRDPGWKQFYVETMDKLKLQSVESTVLKLFSAEAEAERRLQEGSPEAAVQVVQKLLDSGVGDGREERGWYLQEIARYTYSSSKTRANDLQVQAHKINRYLLKPRTGMVVEKLELRSQKRVAAIVSWLQQFETNEAMLLAVEEILANLQFGVKADDFEQALHHLAAAIGFDAQRPDKEWKEGPDNLWVVRNGEYMLFECKSDVGADRDEIARSDSGQMNNACVWFADHYPGARVKNLMIIPARKVGGGAGFSCSVEIIRRGGLKRLVRNVRGFLGEFKNVDLRDIEESRVQKFLSSHELSVDDLLAKYSESPISS
jgi:replicative superfamily II helicase